MLNFARVRILPCFAAAAFAAALAAPVAAVEPQSDGRAVIQAMGDAVIATLRAGADRTTRETRFREMYRRYFDNAGIAATVIGPALQQAAPAQRQQALQEFETYVVRVYAAKLADYAGEKLLVMGSEAEGGGIVVTSQLVDPDPRAARNIEIKWRLANVGGQLKVRDVVIDKISMVLTQRREFASMMQERGGTLDGLLAAMRQKAAEAEDRPARPGGRPSSPGTLGR